MEPHADRLDLPQPLAQSGVSVGMAGQLVPELPPMPAVAPMAQPQASATIHAPVAPAVPLPAQPVAAIASDDANDALDQEWINKAKAIVEKTKHDPFAQSHEIGKIKADYLRIRFNKNIKVVEEPPR